MGELVPEAGNGWHEAKTAQISCIAQQMARICIYRHDAPQTPEYEALRQEYLWQLHVKAEHSKFIPPDYGDHRNG